MGCAGTGREGVDYGRAQVRELVDSYRGRREGLGNRSEVVWEKRPAAREVLRESVSGKGCEDELLWREGLDLFEARGEKD